MTPSAASSAVGAVESLSVAVLTRSAPRSSRPLSVNCASRATGAGVGHRDSAPGSHLSDTSSFYLPGFLLHPPNLEVRSTGWKGTHLLSNLLCFMVIIRFRAQISPALDQHFSPGLLAKCITALPSWDGQQLPGPGAACTSPALPGLPEGPTQSGHIQLQGNALPAAGRASLKES